MLGFAKARSGEDMYYVTVEERFTASHGIIMPSGQREAVHDHDWRVRACFRRANLDELGMVLDFGEAMEALKAALGALAGRNLNDHPALAGQNPTAEVVARYVFDALAKRGFPMLYRVEVTEAPGCTAAYEPQPSAGSVTAAL